MDTGKRLLSLDVFRGMTIALMILVNCPGDWGTTYRALLHAEWHGFTPTDMVFPFFLFIVGIAILFSLSRRKAEGANRGQIYTKIISRTLWIIGIGLFLNLLFKFNFSTWRLPGVLQRIGLVYGITAIIFLNTNIRQQFWILIALLLSYWAMMTLIPVPGQGFASLEKGQDLGAWIDRIFLTGHMWSQSKTWDPEGLFSTIPAIGTCLVGVLTGEWIKSKKDEWQKWAAIFAMGFLLFLVGLLWGEVFPINKPLWTSSYVVLHSGLALLTLGTIWWLVDVKGYKGWATPFIWFGMNPLFIFILHVIITKVLILIKIGDLTAYKWLFVNGFASWLGPYNASLAFAIFIVLINLSVAWWLWKRKIFIKV